MLILPIKKKWFDMILSGEKKQEYREIKPYWTTRFKSAGLLMNNGHASSWAKPVLFKNRYGKNAPTFVAHCTLNIQQGKPEWGAEPGVIYYALQIWKIER